MLSGIVIDVRFVIPLNALSPIEVTLLGIIVEEHPWIKVFVFVSMIALQLLRESYFVLPDSTMMEVRFVQSLNLQIIVSQFVMI
jgi:hypothetical protein